MESIYKSTESIAYLKKSELPKNVSAFKNDAGYISSSALDEWLRSHSYISKEEIQSLIASANLVVIDSIQESSDSEAIRRLEEYDNQLRGEIVEIKDRISTIETGSGFIPSSKESSFVTKTELNGVKDDLDDVKDSITQLETNSQNYLTEHQSLAEYAKKSEIPTIPSLTGYAKKSELEEVRNEIPVIDTLVTKEELNNKNYLTEHQSLEGYAKTTDVNRKINQLKLQIPVVDNFVTKEELNNKNYLTEHQSLAEYAKKSEIPSLSSYVKESELETTLKDYALKDNVYTKSYIDTVVDTLLPKTDASRTYATKSDVTSTYVTKKDAANKYLAIADYIGIKDATTISEEYKNKQLQDLINDLDIVMSGFYIINQTDVVIVKNHKLISIFKDGVQHGIDGKSAYEIAVDNGYTGTETEWLASLKGEDGEMGVDGKSAYEIAVDNGYTGTEAEWIESLGGIPGKSAYDVACDNGFDGSEDEWLNSLKGSDGTNGIDGSNGKSAYQIACDNGYIGTEQEWLTTLGGEDGEDGSDGESAYQIAVRNGFEGDEESWLESLRGTPIIKWKEI